ncbi:MAG: tetratricopeptide repeat protein [Bacteroidia bacterium]|nr:tetratricopeptide repeat protein [Bacteroidia bacterium]
MTKTIGILVICLLIGLLSVQAQPRSIDSIRARIDTYTDPTMRVQTMNDLAWELRHVEPMEAMKIAKEAYSMAVDAQYREGQAWALRNIHVIHTVIGDYPGSVDPAWKALKIFEELKDVNGLAAMYTNIGLVRRELGNSEEARDMFLSALAQKPTDPFQIANPRLNLGMIYIELRDWENALVNLQTVVDLFKKLNDELSVSIAYYNLGYLYDERGEYTEALDWYQKALDIRRKHHDKRRTANSLFSVGSIHRKTGRYLDAIEYLSEALELNKEVHDLKQIEETYQEIALTYASLGNYEQAYKAHTLFAMMKDSVLSDAKAKDLRLNDLKHEVDFQKERNELLEQTRRLERMIAIGASVAFLLVLVFSFFLYAANKSKTRINEQLRAMQNQLVVQEKLASLGQLTAGIAHEIQNPLNFINNFAQGSIELLDELDQSSDNVEEKKAIMADLRQSVSKIHEHGARADGIVRSMMMHARSSSETRQYANVNTLLTDASRLAAHGVRSEGALCKPRMDLLLDPALPVINIVPQDVSRVFVNILNNALDAVCERSLHDADYQPVIQIASAVKNKDIEIRIRDNGPGIPEHVKKRIFDPFFTTKDSGKGTGLGLSISYDIIVQKHGGRIEVESRDDEFTEFIILLPVLDEVKLS